MNALSATARPDSAAISGVTGGFVGFARGHARRRAGAMAGLAALAGLFLAGAMVGERAGTFGESPAPGVIVAAPRVAASGRSRRPVRRSTAPAAASTPRRS